MSEPRPQAAPPPETPDEPAPSLAARFALYQRAGGVITPLLTAVLAFFVGGLVVLVTTGKNPLDTYKAIFNGTGLAVGAPHRTDAVNWLKVVGSKEGQEAFNPKKGSICSRTDCDMSVFDAYLKSSATDFKANELTPSEAHGSAAPEGFVTEFQDIVFSFVTGRDAEAAQTAMQQACTDNGMCT